MTEKASYQGRVITIGTCSTMNQLRYDQRELVQPVPGSCDPVRSGGSLYYRLPFPGEDRTAPGEFDPPFRSLPVAPGDLPCPGCGGTTYSLIAQRPLDDCLATVVQCPDCIMRLGLKQPFDAAKVLREITRPGQDLPEAGLLADRLAAGYRPAAAGIASDELTDRIGPLLAGLFPAGGSHAAAVLPVLAVPDGSTLRSVIVKTVIAGHGDRPDAAPGEQDRARELARTWQQETRSSFPVTAVSVMTVSWDASRPEPVITLKDLP